MKRCDRHRFPAFARGFHHARFHFAGGFFREGQRQDVFAGNLRIRTQQLADALGDDARFSRARACDHQQRSFAVQDRTTLCLVQF